MAVTFVFHGERQGKFHLSVLWCLHITDHFWSLLLHNILSILFNCIKMITVIHYYDLTQRWKRNFFFPQFGRHSSMERIRHRRSLLLNDISLHLVPLAVFLSDYQRMRLFGGQNHLIIFSRTNVSDHFLFSNGNSAFRYVLYSQRRQNETQPSFRTTAVSCVNSMFHSSPTIHVHFLPFELIQRNSRFWFLRGAYTAFPTAKNVTSNHTVDTKSMAN